MYLKIVNETSWRDVLSVHRPSGPKVHPYLLCLMYSGRSLSISLLRKSWKIRTLYGSGSNTILSLSSPMPLESFCPVSAARTLAVKPTRLCKCNFIGCLALLPSICLPCMYFVCGIYTRLPLQSVCSGSSTSSRQAKDANDILKLHCSLFTSKWHRRYLSLLF